MFWPANSEEHVYISAYVISQPKATTEARLHSNIRAFIYVTGLSMAIDSPKSTPRAQF